jgi:hypothetical protein
VRHPGVGVRVQPPADLQRSTRLLPGVASSPKPDRASWRWRRIKVARGDSCERNSACTAARAAASADGSSAGSVSSARCTASRGNGHWLTVSGSPPSSTSTSMALRPVALGVHGTEAACAADPSAPIKDKPATEQACAVVPRGRKASSHVELINSTLSFLVGVGERRKFT